MKDKVFISFLMNLSEKNIFKLFDIKKKSLLPKREDFYLLKKGDKYIWKVIAINHKLYSFRQFLELHRREKNCPLITKRGPILFCKKITSDVENFFKNENNGFRKENKIWVISQPSWPPLSYKEEKYILSQRLDSLSTRTDDRIKEMNNILCRAIALQTRYNKIFLQNIINKLTNSLQEAN